MAGAVEIEVTVSPGLASPVPLGPYLEKAVTRGTENVRVAGEANISTMFRPRGQWAARYKKPGYGPLHGSLTTLIVAPKSEGAGAAGFVRTTVFYALFLELGAKPHRIVPKARTASAVLPILQPDGTAHFRPRADHPGIRAQFWMRKAVQRERPGVLLGIAQAAQAWARDAERGMTRGMRS